MPIKDLPAEARPREKLLARGPAALSDVELLAILLRTGIQGKGVLQMADELLKLKNDSCSRTIDGVSSGFGDPHAIKHYLKLHLAAQNRLLAMEEMFRGTLTQLSVTLLRKYFDWLRHFTTTSAQGPTLVADLR